MRYRDRVEKNDFSGYGVEWKYAPLKSRIPKIPLPLVVSSRGRAGHGQSEPIKPRKHSHECQQEVVSQ